MPSMPVKKPLKPLPKPPTIAQLLSNAIKIVDIMVSTINKPNFSVAKYADGVLIWDAVMLLVRSRERHRVANLPEVWLDLLLEDNQEELVQLTRPAEEKKEEQEQEQEQDDADEFFWQSARQFLSMSVQWMCFFHVTDFFCQKHHSTTASSPAVANKEQSVKAKPSPTKGKVVATAPTHARHGRLSKAATQCVGWLSEETLATLLLVSKNNVVVESFLEENCAKKHKREDDKDAPGPLQKWSHLPEAEVKPLVALLSTVEHKMLELQKSLQMVQKALDTITSWAEQVQTLLGRALAE
ncbi:hypothetical protein DACRYDRAFT_108293 [Dacryopinax primogenitus]|uniref:Uncharacterized protein n=1 Tax=Dacryopinax primogenitus (strain DJM 731) TaxID=1858805 RepID=M5FYK1_DACPD|nr:uncharacterized protein DACRYDRAFT_108293 [Dacryopinax primogenitus]EJU00950.1 hypothetical protein DACRYDRAFT_108293 [Dacryopinax primogenitus]